MKAFVEGSGCSLNKSDTEQIRGFLLQNNFELVSKPESADLLLLNACAVKEQTETKMLRRIVQLNSISKKQKSTLVVFGCFPKINPLAISSISKKIVQIGPCLEKLASFLELPEQNFSPDLNEKKTSNLISIIPICRGCLGNCAYCAVRNARGKLKSYSIAQLNKKFKQGLEQGCSEFWLTAQDCGCYGFDIGTNIVALLKTLLRNKGNFRIRVGMANPAHLKKFLPEYLALFEHKRLFRFFHLPVQSGSNAVLEKMNRGYKKEDFLLIVKKIRKRFPNASISLDLIVGFPGETEQQFEETLFLVEKVKPDVVNISRFGARPNTLAALMPGQLHGREKKERSRKLTVLCKRILLERNKGFIGSKQLILVDKKGLKGNFVGRNQNYKPIVVKKPVLGSFVSVKVKKVFSNYLEASVAK